MNSVTAALRIGLGVLVGALLPACSHHNHAHESLASHSSNATVASSVTVAEHAPDDALRRLQEGNARFVSGEMRHPHEARTWRTGLEGAQHPFATVIGCSDSRVPLELLFDQGFGDLFVIRVAGNLIARDEAGSIEYAVAHLHTPIVAVIGHEHCGAVTAALGTHEEIMSEPQELSDLLAAIHVGMPEIPYDLPKEERVARGVDANVRHAMEQLHKVPTMQHAVECGDTRVVGGVYDLHTGAVRWLD
ncbi:MAG: carbonic anhydrase [Phycisphaerales bacterium]|nr:carbonic anhydrase [Phycisphaerales bacterium]